MLTRFFKYSFCCVLVLQNFVFSHALAADSQPIRIGVSLGLTGIYSEIGRVQKLAYQLWQEQINQNGGILGRSVEVIIRDDQSDAKVAEKIYEQFIEGEKVDLVFGPYSSPITAAVAPITEKFGYPMPAPGAASEELWRKGYQNLFGVLLPNGRYSIGLFALLTKLGLKRVAVISVDDTFSVGIAEGTKRWAPEYEITIVSFQVLPKKDPDLVAAAKLARAKGAEVVIMAGHFEESINMKKALKKIGWNPTAYYASVGPTLQKYHDTLSSDAVGTLSTTTWEPREDLRMPGSAEFLKAFRAHFNETPSQLAAAAYAAGQILEQAVLKAGTIDRAKVRRAMSSMSIDTIIGRYAVDRAGLQVKRFPLIIQWQGNKREIVWPAQAQTAEFIPSDSSN